MCIKPSGQQGAGGGAVLGGRVPPQQGGRGAAPGCIRGSGEHTHLYPSLSLPFRSPIPIPLSSLPPFPIQTFGLVLHSLTGLRCGRYVSELLKRRIFIPPWYTHLLPLYTHYFIHMYALLLCVLSGGTSWDYWAWWAPAALPWYTPCNHITTHILYI
jgi:hypothetical protein